MVMVEGSRQPGRVTARKLIDDTGMVRQKRQGRSSDDRNQIKSKCKYLTYDQKLA